MPFEPFDRFAQQYDEWFDKNRFIYESELQALKELLPESKNSIEVGVGSGRFAAPLNIKVGIDPSREIGKIAKKRNIKVIEGIAESLPFHDSQFDLVLMVTTICFLEDVEKALKEAYRVLKFKGHIIVGFIDAESPMGKYYEEHKSGSRFYAQARFFSVKQVISLLKKVHFNDLHFRQTIFNLPNQLETYEPVKKGYGEGSFIVVRGIKQNDRIELRG
jgi:ubiquinone/menaquinone biosynthesis C-methylase UbiE